MEGREKKQLGVHSIQTKMMGVSLLIAVGTAIVSLLISYYTEINTIKSTTEKYMGQYISFADKEFNNMLVESQKIILSVAMAQGVLSPNMLEPGEEATYTGFLKRKQIRSFLSSFLSQKEYIEEILIITDEKEVYQAGSELIVKKELETPVMQKALSSKAFGIIYDESTKSFLLCRPAVYCQGTVMASVIIRLDYEFITSVYDIEPLQSVALYLYLPENQLFYTNDNTKKDRTGLEPLLQDNETSTGYIDWDGEMQYYIRYVSRASRMTLIGLIPQDVLLKDAQDLKSKFLLIGLGASAAAILASAYLSKRICANLKSLSGGMEAVRAGNLSVRMQIPASDEIAELADTFNVMMERIEMLMEEVREQEKMKREAEQDVLASQIEPHFLYNSIDSIKYVAHMRKETEIEQVAVSLSELLRSVLSNHNEFITLWEEKDYIEYYMTIERFKYRMPFEVIWDVDEALWAYPVPKLLLQPVVENALIHGINSKEGDGVINIKIYGQQNEVILKVMDNGKGISEERIQALLSNLQQKDKSGFRRIGIANVFSRIRLIYGEEYGGTIYSMEGMFTCVELHLPLGGGSDGFDSIVG